jgi:N-acetylmuramoyl-L-alanine amidase
LSNSGPQRDKPLLLPAVGPSSAPKRLRAALPRPLLLLAILVASGVSASAASKRDRADAAFERAIALQSALAARRPEARSPKDYEKVVRAFDVVYRIDPGYPKTPASIAAEAATYQEMGQAFASDRYYESAVTTYEFLIDQYPWASLARDALFTIAEIYRVDLENPEEAAKAYRQFLQKYPQAAKATDARARLEQINRRLAEARAEIAPAKRASINGHDAAPPPSPAAESPPGRLTEVNDVRFWQGADYTRIVISVKDKVKFEAVRLSHPDRIVFDLTGTRLSPALGGRAFPVGNGFLQQIRVAQFKPDVTRVVLDIEKIGDYSVFSLPNPFRLIIDVHGPPPPLVARARSEPASANAATSAAASASAAARSSSSETDRPLPPNGTRQPLTGQASAPAKSLLPPGSDAMAPDSTSLPSTPQPALAQTTLDASAHPAAVSGPQQVHASAPTSNGSTTLTRALGLKISRIVIDPGHGGHDTGTIGPTGLEEKAVVLDVALRLRKLVEQRLGSSVVMTRTDDTFIPLEERTAIANQQGADLFISIHANASADRSARGLEVYYLNFTSDPNSLAVAARENATSQESVHQLQNLIKKIALSEKIEESGDFAQQVDFALDRAITGSGNHQPDRGLKKAPFVVLIGADMPSILAEISFLSNARDEKLLRQARYRQKIAEGLYRGIARYVSNLSGVKIAQQSRDVLPAVRTGAHTRLGAASGNSLADPPGP